MRTEGAATITDDAALGGRLRLLQPRCGHRFGHDAILLAAAVNARTGDRAIDLGAGVGTAGLALATRVAGVKVTLVDVDASLTELAVKNIARNGCGERVNAVTLDVAAAPRPFAAQGLKPGVADWVLMNPPFHDFARLQPSPAPARRAAHEATARMLGGWLKTAARLLKSGGHVAVIYRADGLGEVLAALGDRFGAIEILPVYPRPGAAAIRIVIRATKAAKGPLALRPGLTLNGMDGRPTPESEAILRDAAPFTG